MEDTHSAPTRPRCRPALVVVLGLGLLAAGCDAGGDAGGPPDTPASATDATTPGDGTTPPASPLAAYINVTDDPDQVARERQRFRRYEQAVADCMDAQGFTWEPDDDREGEADHEDRPQDMPRDEFVATYGYGITTIDDGDEPATGGAPDVARLDAMTVARRTAWYRALLGDDVALDDQGRPPAAGKPVASQPGTDRGCVGRAEEEVFGQDVAEESTQPDRFAPLIEDIQRLGDRVDADPRVQEAVQRWRACMADHGFGDVTGPDEPAQRVRQRLADLGDPPPPDELAALRRHELDVAAADHACSTDLDQVRQRVRTEIERAFVADHREQLEAFRDARATTGDH